MAHAAAIARYRGDIAEARHESADASRAAELLLKAIGGLPEEEQRIALTHLVERAIAPAGETARAKQLLPMQIAEMVLAGQGLREAAQSKSVPEDVVRAAFEEAAAAPNAREPLPALLRLVAEGKTPSEAKKELGLSDKEVGRVLRQILPPEPPEAAQFFPAGARGGPQRVVPVRFPEEQYERLKDWCTDHGFPMAVVVRGLVERFLDGQDRRAA